MFFFPISYLFGILLIPVVPVDAVFVLWIFIWFVICPFDHMRYAAGDGRTLRRRKVVVRGDSGMRVISVLREGQGVGMLTTVTYFRSKYIQRVIVKNS